MSFDQLLHVAKLSAIPGHELVFEWSEKRQQLAVYLQDFPTLVEQHKKAKKTPYEKDPKITLVDLVPQLRLSSACEGATNCLYGTAEIAAQFANQASRGLMPTSFNAFRKKAERGAFDGLPNLKLVGDYGWYRKVRELRTEWAHYSTIFVGEDKAGDPILVVRCRRRPSDRHEFPDKVQVTVPELRDWIKRAIATIDSFGDAILIEYVLPNLDLSHRFISPKYDENGWPIFRPDSTMEMEEITVADHLARCGITSNKISV